MERGIRRSVSVFRACILTLISALIAAVFMAASPVQALAIEDKTLEVSQAADAEYKTIQEAIDFIATQEDKTGWTIEVSAGTYGRFTVLDGLDGLNVVSDGGAVVKTMDGSTPPASGSNPDTGGVSIRNADDVTLSGFTFESGALAQPWYASAVSTHTESAAKPNGLTVDNCVFSGESVAFGAGVFISSGVNSWNVTNCVFSGYKEAIGMYGDGTLLEGAVVTGNSFSNCSFALHGYYGGVGDAGVLAFSGNEVVGSDDLRCKVVVQDQLNTGAVRVDVSDNVFADSIVGLVNLREAGEAVSSVLESNSFAEGSFYVEAIEPGTIDFYTAYHAPSNESGYAAGYWGLTGIEDFDVDWGKNPDGSTAVIEDLIKKANVTGSKSLNITGIDEANLIKTFTWFKDGIYWESYPVAGDLVVSKIVQGDGADLDQKFKFTISLNDKTLSGTYGDMVFFDGVATVELANGQSAAAKGLPAQFMTDGGLVSLEYVVTELPCDGYESTSENAEGTLEEGVAIDVSFVNTKSVPVEPVAPTEPEQPSAPEDSTEKSTSFAKTSDAVSFDAIALVAIVALAAGTFVAVASHVRKRS